MKGKKEQEKRLQKEMESRRHKNAKIKKYFADYQLGFKKSLKRKKLNGNVQFLKFFVNFNSPFRGKNVETSFRRGPEHSKNATQGA